MVLLEHGAPLGSVPWWVERRSLLDRDRGLGGAEMGVNLALSSGEAARVN